MTIGMRADLFEYGERLELFIDEASKHVKMWSHHWAKISRAPC